jgi:hypothetical protein
LFVYLSFCPWLWLQLFQDWLNKMGWKFVWEIYGFLTKS